MNKLFGYLASAIVVGGLLFALVQCTDSECGNGVKESGEQCDNGSKNGTQGNDCSAQCKLVSVPRATLSLQLAFLEMESPNFPGSNESDLGVANAHVVISGPQMIDETWAKGKLSYPWSGVPAGDYQATVTLFDASGNALTKDVTSPMGHVDVPGTLNLKVNFHQSDFLKQDYMGVLYVSPNWGTLDTSCSAAVPAVDQESIQVLTATGTTLTGWTLMGDPGANEHNLDGTYGTCFYKSGVTLFEKVPNLTWGHYQVIVRGKSSGLESYCKKFDDLFVGPGIQNPTYELAVTAADSDLGACP
jgi:hypothetical protein